MLYYKSLVSEIIDKGDYDYFAQCLIINYNIDVMKYRSISEMENATWENICFQALTPVQEKLKTFYSKQNIYQLGYNIYSDDISYLSLTWSSPLSATFSVVGTSSRISFSQVNNLVNINLLDSNFYYFITKKAYYYFPFLFDSQFHYLYLYYSQKTDSYPYFIKKLPQFVYS
mgnify:CR=1 FL=1